ncbi:MAG: heat-inducible transcriptional repressor HrcA [Acidobacteriota bacterium]|jgi:heat-inducible transcriptional repressor
MEKLNGREETVLLEVVRISAETHRPVGSQTLAGAYGERVSSATVRSILKTLEDKGFLLKTHVSSGRIPSDKAYRYCVKNILERLDTLEMEEGEAALADFTSARSMEEIVKDASRRMASSMHWLGFATTPIRRETRLKACELIRITEEKLLIVLVSLTGQVHQQWFASPGQYSEEQLKWFSNYLSDVYEGWCFRDIRAHLQLQLRQEQTLADKRLGEILGLIAPAFSESASKDVFWEGVGWLLESPELQGDLVSVRKLFEALEKKDRLLRLLDQIWDQVLETGVVMGDEWPEPGVRSLALIAAPYGVPGMGRGLVGIIGPKCMRFDRTIPGVSRTARLLTEAAKSF